MVRLCTMLKLDSLVSLCALEKLCTMVRLCTMLKICIRLRSYQAEYHGHGKKQGGGPERKVRLRGCEYNH